MKIVFVILHYLAYKDTIECAESILSNDNYKNKEIVIVDNGSNDNSYELLVEYFYKIESITILKNENNLGFAAGNNIGYLYAKYKLDSDFIILLNNDTLLNQKNFCNIILSKYKKYNFDILGPDIITLNNEHQNPFFRNFILSKKYLIKFRIFQYLRIFFSKMHLNKLHSFLYEIKHNNKNKNENRIVGDLINVNLHGACLIFSPNYIDKFEGLDNRTFLYFEEDILKLYAIKYKLLMMYTDSLTIVHKEDVSTNIAIKDSTKKSIFMFRQRIKSSKIYEIIKSEFNI